MNTLSYRRAAGLLLACLLLLPAGVQVQARAGLTLQATRVIYPASATGGITFSVTNNTRVPYLMQSRVSDPDAATASATATPGPFVALPPLQRLDPGDTLTLRIRLMNAYLHRDRESLFALTLNAIPATPATDGALVLATRNQLKLFYRPDGLPGYGMDEVATRLRFQRQGQQLRVDNPTPYWATFGTLTLGSNAISSARMVPPLGYQVYPLTGNGSELTWQLINDYGEPTPLQHRVLPAG